MTTRPLAAEAQQAESVRRIGVLTPGSADSPEYEARNGAFLQALGTLGWNVGRNVRIDYRWGAGREFIASRLASGSSVVRAMAIKTLRVDTSLSSSAKLVSCFWASAVD